MMSKAGAEVILKTLLGLEVDVDALPWGPDEEDEVQMGIETVVEATEVRGRDGRRVLEWGGGFEGEEGEGEGEGSGWVKKEKTDEDCIVIKDEPDD